ncbi:bifunctional metallophosphatase/5'-nucleotidase [Maridesulfovibrio frigidus]|uniref:bifunctional metallophosphatase/5'-nucleotidase n=1 Tax=Maridesulfovibrio frigidus TaxID=340956 RepID=UPI0004E23136|nr:bifunctional UDP-sugar hydrolase/5'-nucleotidase [Maridesulfovibrio frigidus]
MRPFMTLMSLIAILLLSTPCNASKWDLVFLTTSGLNGQLTPATEKDAPDNGDMLRTFGGFARIQTVFESYRAKFPDSTITVATGDDLMGESIQIDQGKTIFRAMDMMGFDASTLGNHEFDRGANFLAKSLANKNFPTVVSNLEIMPNSRLRKYITPYTIIERNFIKVGIMGLVLPELKLISNPGTSISVNADLIKIARETALKLKNEDKANIIVMLSHLTIEDQKKILENVPEIDIICGGQTHKDILPGQEIINRKAPTPGIMVQCGTRGRFVGVLKLQIEGDKIKQHDWSITPVANSIVPSKKTYDFIQSKIKDLPQTVKLTISPMPLNTEVKIIRTQEAPIGRLISSIMRTKFKTDLAFQNSGGIRGDKIIPSGPIHARDIDIMFPFGNTITIIKASGKDLKETLEHSVSKLPKASGRFLHISGLKFTLALDETPQELEMSPLGKPIGIKTPGSRVSKIKVMNKSGKYIPIEADKMYSITTNSFLAGGGDGYLALKYDAKKVETFIKISEVIKSGILKMKELKIENTTTTFGTDGKPFFKVKND